MNTTYHTRLPKTAAQRYLDGWDGSDSHPEFRETNWDVLYGNQQSKHGASAIGGLRGLWLAGLGLGAVALVGWRTLHQIQKRASASSLEETFKFSVASPAAINDQRRNSNV